MAGLEKLYKDKIEIKTKYKKRIEELRGLQFGRDKHDKKLKESSN